MKTDRLDSLLGRGLIGAAVPPDLAARITKAVHKRAAVLERRQIWTAALQLTVGLTAVIYGFTATLLNVLSSNLSGYLGVAWESPANAFSGDGLQALLEQIPVLSIVIFFMGLVYSLRHLIVRGVTTRKLSSVMAALFVVVALGSFAGGMAVGAHGEGGLTADASEVLFQPLLQNPSDSRYSSSGEVQVVENAENGDMKVTLSLPNGKEKTLLVPSGVLREKKRIEEGDHLFILGRPSESTEETNGSFELRNRPERGMQVHFVKVQ